MSGKPGMVHPMHGPPAAMQPPMWDWNPRETMLQFTTGPQQPTSTRHSLSPYSLAKTPSS